MGSAGTTFSGVLGRSRSSIIAGARQTVPILGIRRTTMLAVARQAGVSKATLYNHVRDKDELLLLLIADGCQRAAAAAAAAGSVASERLAAAAAVVADDEVLVALRGREPAALVPMLAIGAGPAWKSVREHTREMLTSAGLDDDHDNVDLTLRWLMSYVLTPGDADARQRAARRLVAALSGSTTLQVVSANHSWSADPSRTA